MASTTIANTSGWGNSKPQRVSAVGKPACRRGSHGAFFCHPCHIPLVAPQLTAGGWLHAAGELFDTVLSEHVLAMMRSCCFT
jgi:hypothetical protein